MDAKSHAKSGMSLPLHVFEGVVSVIINVDDRHYLYGVYRIHTTVRFIAYGYVVCMSPLLCF